MHSAEPKPLAASHSHAGRFETAVVAINRWLLIALLLAMSCIIFANVVLRYTTGESIVWAEEVARHMMIALTFLGMGLVLRVGGHVAIDNLHRSAGERGARWLRALVAAGVGIFCVVMAVASSEYVWRTRFQTTAATDIPIAFIYAVMPIGFLLTALHLTFIARHYIAKGEYAANQDEVQDNMSASIY